MGIELLQLQAKRPIVSCQWPWHLVGIADSVDFLSGRHIFPNGDRRGTCQFFRTQTKTGWWLNQPIRKTCFSNLIISPRFGVNKNNLSCHHPEKLEFRNAKAHFQLFNDLSAWGWGWCSLRLYLLWIEGRAFHPKSCKVGHDTQWTNPRSSLKVPFGFPKDTRNWLQVNSCFWFP